MQALDSIDAFCQNGASQQEALGLLQDLKTRLSERLLPEYQQMDPKAAVLARRFNELLDQVRSDSSRVKRKAHPLQRTIEMSIVSSSDADGVTP
jgi:hypothetical protein